MKKLKIPLIYTSIIFIAILHAFNYQLFIVENSFAPAGLNGIATMVQYKTGFSIGYMSLLINVPLCVLAYFFVDKKFALRSLVFCITYSLAFLVLQKLGLENLQYDADGHDTVFPVTLSGIIGGFVYGVSFRNNSSTGGTDIISKYISKRKPELNFFWVTFILNAVVALVSFFVYAKNVGDTVVYDYKPVCLCIMYCFISSYIGSHIIKSTKTAYKFTVVTDKPDEIADDILKNLKHSSTEISVIGSYSHDKKTMLMCVVNKHQIADFRALLEKYEGTFAFSETVNETYGNFKRIK